MKRTVLAAVMAAALGVGVFAQGAATKALPLDNLGLEHLDIIVPDPAASARFYARIFTSALHQQPVRDTLRYFVLLGDLPADRQVGYIAIGAAGQRQPAIGHYCVLTTVYDRAGMATALQGAGFGVAGAGPTGMWPDPDRLELQLFQPPAGLVTAAVPRRSRPNATVCSRRAVSITCCCASAASRSRSVLPDGLRHRGGTATRRQRACLVSAGTQHSSRSRRGSARAGAHDRSLCDHGCAVRPQRVRRAAARVEGTRDSIGGRARRRSLRRRQRHHRRSESSEVTRGVKALVIVLMLAADGGEPIDAQRSPDFTGVWTDYVDAQQPAGAGGGQPAGALDLPLTSDARRKVDAYRKLVAPTGDTPGAYCLGPGMPGVIFGGGTYPMEIIHRPDRSRSFTSCTTTCGVSISAAATCRRPIGCPVAMATRLLGGRARR